MRVSKATGRICKMAEETYVLGASRPVTAKRLRTLWHKEFKYENVMQLRAWRKSC